MSETAELLIRGFTISTETFNAAENTIEVSFASTTPVRRRDWTGPFDEILAISKAAIDQTRLNTGAMSLLDSHNSWSMDSRLGVVLPNSVRIEGGKAYATVKLSSDKAASLIRDLQDGLPFAVSVGYRIHEFSISEDDVPTKTITKWEPVELSAVPVPADPTAQTRKEPSMPQAQTENRNEKPTRTRADEDASILSLAKRFGFDPKDELITRSIGEKMSYDDFRERLLDHLSERDAEINTNHAGAPLNGNASFVTDATNALLARMGGTVDLAGNQFGNLSPLQIGRRCLENAGVNMRSASDHEVASRLLNMGRSEDSYWMNRAGGGFHTTGDFPIILGNALHKLILERFAANASPLKALSRRREAPDFRKMSLVRPGEAPRLMKVLEAGEIKAGTMEEEGEGLQIATFARIINLSLQLLVNDDLSAFSDLALAFGESAAETEADEFFKLLSANSFAGATTGDSNPLFHADHGNLGSAAALSLDALSAARIAMRTQKSVDGQTVVGVTPAVLLVGPALETKAQQLVAEVNAQSVDDVNVFTNRLQVAVENRLDASTAWYLFAAPSNRQSFTHAYLSGTGEGPQVTTNEGWEVLGTGYRAVLHFGCAVQDWRAAYRNPGA